MKTGIVVAALLAWAPFTAGHAETVNEANLDQFLDRLAEKNKGMGTRLT